jgi:hypothetical protein
MNKLKREKRPAICGSFFYVRLERSALSLKSGMIQLSFKFKKSGGSSPVSMNNIEYGDKQIHSP